MQNVIRKVIGGVERSSIRKVIVLLMKSIEFELLSLTRITVVHRVVFLHHLIFPFSFRIELKRHKNPMLKQQ